MTDCDHKDYFYVAPFESAGGTYVWFIKCQDCGRCIWAYIRPSERNVINKIDKRHWFFTDEKRLSGYLADHPHTLAENPYWRMPDELIFF